MRHDEPPPDHVELAAFLSSLAHDLRSPLGVVSEVIGELGTDFASQLSDEHRLLVKLASRGVVRLGRIADALSLLAALEGDQLDLRRQSVDLTRLVRGAADRALAVETRRDVDLVCELPEGDHRVSADEARLRHCLAEIMINALVHARRHVRVRLDVTAAEARVVVEDDGPGIADLDEGALFDRFDRRRASKGLGMGLSTAREVVAAHGGTITVEASTLPPSAPGAAGARFVVSLPFSTGA
jgi:two-component system OmpR family sensor kinase